MRSVCTQPSPRQCDSNNNHSAKSGASYCFVPPVAPAATYLRRDAQRVPALLGLPVRQARPHLANYLVKAEGDLGIQ